MCHSQLEERELEQTATTQRTEWNSESSNGFEIYVRADSLPTTCPSFQIAGRHLVMRPTMLRRRAILGGPRSDHILATFASTLVATGRIGPT